LKDNSQKFSDIYNKSIAKKNSLRKSRQESSGESEIIDDETLYSIEDEEENDEDMVFDVRVSNCLFTQLVHTEFCSCFFANVGLGISIIYFEIQLQMNENGLVYDGMALELAQFYSGTCTFMLIISIYIRYVLWLEWAKTVEKYTKYDGFINTGLWKEVLIEILINLVSPMPFFNGIKYTEYVEGFDTTI
jgi:hypothetical protein